jgi:hypothetical protein
MAFDGRDLIQKPPEDAAVQAYNSKGLDVVAKLIIWIPLALLVWLTYLSGTFFGGIWGGIGSVISTVATIAVVYYLKRLKQAR